MAEIIIPARDSGSLSAYVAMPAITPAPTVIVIQEIFGVNKVMRDICDDLAQQGFIAVCPDLFWRIEPGIQLTDRSEAEWKRAFELFNLFDVDQGVEDLRATEHVFKGHAQSTGQVGCLGYCLGGKLAYLMAARTNIDCAVSYYGVGIDQLLGETDNIKRPLLMHIAAEDKFLPKDAQSKIVAAMEKNYNVTSHVYDGVDHAFARVGGDHYDAAAAEKANARTRAFLSGNLLMADAA
ncbi:MAG: dienelactone hydrolase family protein [Alphaproteobacteria bacterium]|nr:dienelactone hydrolase family protein [Alphaproteobacteria bacterium]